MKNRVPGPPPSIEAFGARRARCWSEGCEHEDEPVWAGMSRHSTTGNCRPSGGVVACFVRRRLMGWLERQLYDEISVDSVAMDCIHALDGRHGILDVVALGDQAQELLRDVVVELGGKIESLNEIIEDFCVRDG